ncbi:hypothetical protein [Parapedobacter tibetensis]|uniref:hypothetical protein n=1 Tax=Parapedobacter tibetensis TaxID=2972951 RepID=UPI00214D90C8|nr:hypothetical protein [Parapedobacter tibetensis]
MRASQQLGIGTTGGTLLGIIGQLGLHDVLKTAVLAAIGAAVSFAVTLLLQRWQRRR